MRAARARRDPLGHARHHGCRADRRRSRRARRVRALAGLVNNAGIAVAAPVEFLPIKQLQRQLEINLVGQVAVTQALLPALRLSAGGLSTSARSAARVALPLLGAYAMSKFGLEASATRCAASCARRAWT